MIRIERAVAYGFATFFAVVIIGSTAIPKLLHVKWLWLNYSQNMTIVNFSNAKQWHQLLDGWDWVRGYQMRWTAPGYLSIKVDAKSPIVRIDNETYLDALGGVFRNPHHPYDLPLVDVPIDQYALVVKWVDQLEALGLNVAKVAQKPSRITSFHFKNGATLLTDGLASPVKMGVLPNLVGVLSSSNTCHLYLTNRVSCYAA